MARRGPEVGFYCDACDRYSTWAPPFAPGDERCAHCDAANPPAFAASDHPPPDPAAPLAGCIHCGNAELYSKKDLPQQLGCAVVLIAIALATAAYALWDFPAAFLVFMAFAAADFMIYRRLGVVVVCYRCHAEHRRFPENRAHGAFDMHRAEEYDA